MSRMRVMLIVAPGGAGSAPEQQAIASTLKEAGFALARDGERGRPDVVLLDLPRSQRELDELVARAMAARAPLVVTSADAATLPQRARALGAFGWVPQPLLPGPLRERLRTAVHASRRHPSLFGFTLRR
jgi:AmiR/NasT family two-component response regulator